MKEAKVDLHLHLDGSLSIEVIKKLAKESEYPLEENILGKVSVTESCSSLMEYLKCFEIPILLLQSSYALQLAAYDLVEKLAKQGVVYAEIRFAPQIHTNQGLTQEQAVQAVIKGIDSASKKHIEIKIGLILCALVTGNARDNFETEELAEVFLNQGVNGFDLAGAEGTIPMKQFAPLFQKAAKANLPFTIHAGECGDYHNIATAISFGAKRIGHGCSAFLSEAIMDLLVKEQVTLEMCVTSNVQTKAVPSLGKHPIKMFFDKGIQVTINTDNMTVSNTNLEREYAVVKNNFQMTDEDLQRMKEVAIMAAFLEDSAKQELLIKIRENERPC